LVGFAGVVCPAAAQVSATTAEETTAQEAESILLNTDSKLREMAQPMLDAWAWLK